MPSHIVNLPVPSGRAASISLFTFPFQGGISGRHVSDFQDMTVWAKSLFVLIFPAFKIVRYTSMNDSVTLLEVISVGIACQDSISSILPRFKARLNYEPHNQA